MTGLLEWAFAVVIATGLGFGWVGVGWAEEIGRGDEPIADSVSLGELAARIDPELAVLEPPGDYQEAKKSLAAVWQDIGETALGSAADQGSGKTRPEWELAGVIGGGGGVVRAALRSGGKLHVLAARESLQGVGAVISIDGGRCCVVVQSLGGSERRECLSVCELVNGRGHP